MNTGDKKKGFWGEMASADGGISVKFHLPLQLLINDGKEKLHQDGQEKVFEKLLYDFQSLKEHLQENKNLNCFTLVDVSNEKGSVNLLLEVYGERQLNELYKCLKTEKNLLSECLSNYFFAHNYEGVAELDDNICIECKVSMARSVYFKVLGELSEQEESKSLERSDESQTESGGFDVDTKYTGTNAKDNKPLKTYDSTCNKPQKQPGSYPAQKAPVVRKKFILMYLPEPGYVIKHIKMKSDTCPILNDVKLSLRDGNLYETEIDIPLKLIKQDDSMPFRFDIVFEKTKFLVKYETYERGKEIFVGSSNCQRHIWEQLVSKPKIENIHLGYEEHLTDMLFNCDSEYDLKAKCIEIESFCSPISPMKDVALLKKLAIKLRTKLYDSFASLLFLVTINKLISRHELIEKEQLMDSSNALKLLQSINTCRIESIPTLSQRHISSICHWFCKIAFRENACLLSFLSTLNSFLDSEVIIEKIEKKTKENKNICPDSESMFPFAKDLTTKLYGAAMSDDATGQYVLELLLRNLPVKVAMHVFACLYKDDEKLCSNESDLQNKLYGGITVCIEKKLTAVKKSNNLQDLLHCWLDLEKSEAISVKFKNKFENAVVQILESNNEFVDSIQDKFDVFFNRCGFFKEIPKQEKLMWAIVNSKSHEINKLFISLAKCAEMNEFFFQVNEGQFRKLCLSYIKSISQHFERENELVKAIENLNCIWVMQYIDKRDDLRKVLESILLEQFQTHTFRDVLKKLKVIDKMSSENCDLIRIFLDYVRSSLESNNERFQPEEIFQLLDEKNGFPCIENRLTALVLNVMIDTHFCLSSELPIFETFQHILGHGRFWITLYSCSGPFYDDIKGNEKLSSIRNCIKQIVYLLKHYDVRYDFVMSIETNSQLCETTKRLLVLECTQKECDKYWNDALVKFKTEKDKLRKAQGVIKEICRHLNVEDLYECFTNISKQLSTTESHITNGQITAKECTNSNLIWNGIEELPSLCDRLETIIHSCIFWNLCKEDVKVEYRKTVDPISNENDPLSSICLLFQDVPHQDNEDRNIKNAVKFLQILFKIGIQAYKDGWEKLLNDNSFKMNDVLLMFGKKPNVADEVNIEKRILFSEISEDVVKTLENVYRIDKVKTTVNSVTSVLQAFEIDCDSSFQLAIESFNKLERGAAAEYTFSDVKKALDLIFNSIKGLSENTLNIVEELGKSSSLISFLQEIVDDDIRNLIDAVEDISEQQVKESTVSALIEVKRYIQPILLPCGKRTCQELVSILDSQTRSCRGNPLNLPAKIADCMNHLHNLKSLYNNVANRGEQTKEMIKNISQRGTFIFQLTDECDLVDFEVSYKQSRTKKKKKKKVRQFSTLIDLRSRALLLMNSERKDPVGGNVQPEELSTFVNYINICLDISDVLFQLYSTGYFEVMKMRTVVKPIDLGEKKSYLSEILATWLNDLQLERNKHYLMNFVHGTQIQDLYKYLEGNEKGVSAIYTMLKFIHPAIHVEDIREFYETEKASVRDNEDKAMLHCIGAALTKACSGLPLYERPITFDMYSKRLTDRVQTSKLLVAQLEEGSVNTIKTVIGLYLNTTQRLPEPNQVLFCTRSTTKNELDLLIRRCLGAESFYKSKPLFCIANVELLPNKMQFDLVDTLRLIDRDQKYFLALICRGSRNHPFIDELIEIVTSVTPATDKTVEQIFQEHCASVTTITSDNAGQGKTCFIHNHAQKNEKSVVTLHISGSIRKSNLIKKLLSMDVKECHVLHIDIGIVDDATELDTFIFELIVLRFVSAAKVSISLQLNDIKIEIANTIDDTLRNSLQTAMLFQRKHVEWKGINAFVVSKEIQSPVQVVCKYFECLEKNILDKVDLMALKTRLSPLSKSKCRRLLLKYLDCSIFTSYPLIHTFLNVLADQLKKLSQSSFFRTSRLRDMVGNKAPLTVKSKLVLSMIQTYREFATRSTTECRAAQSSTDVEDIEMKSVLLPFEGVDRVNGMIRWEESNHQVFVFHNQNIHSVSALYRKLNKVEEDVKFLFESQMKKKMEDFSNMDQEALQNILQMVSRTNPVPLPAKKLLSLTTEYALTADNLLKMVLIMLRIRANIPVLIMGETGCGKTSLIRYLTQICEIKFNILNIHAGITAEEILRRVQNANELALKDFSRERWLFLDEINTSENVGMISDIICHHTCLGRELAPNLAILGACNPYKLRTSNALSTAGIDSKVVTDEFSRLVYRVLPLPDMLLDFVWDFGSLSEADERKYILRMTGHVFPGDQHLHDVLTNLLSASQVFVRDKESCAYSVSLRDVQRCKELTAWFQEMLKRKGNLKRNVRYQCDISVKAIILALAHCYHSRFADKFMRQLYREMLSKIFVKHGYTFCKGNGDFILGVIREEQQDILFRMELPPGTACNNALQENVFVILVCILKRIPIFVVGKPGCSKSLAMQLIRSNLRGKDSKDDFFKSLPQLYCVSFQGSESSTSDGILKVFEKAENYQISNSCEDVLSVVILDEIGLAEISRFNPLKVLHNLLEPDGKSQPNVAVVGISNWALDASKMNRAIHLSRTEMDTEELYDTAVSISDSFLDSEASMSKTLFEGSDTDDSVSAHDITKELHDLAKAYLKYTKQMRFKNFHGLRDYYSLVKYVARMFAEKKNNISDAEKANVISFGLERNFGGLPAEKQILYDVFRTDIPLSFLSTHSVLDLVVQNIQDPIARHLMLITSGESVLGIIEQKLQDLGRERIEVIYGSHFEEDLTDDYNYRILSKIILCMEEGVILILKDLESIYGSLYDMLNQNYTTIGKKRNCRVALGPYSNPICHVADTFRCIVLMDESKIDISDPPFLNRFEKQYLRFFDIIDASQKMIIEEIESWIDDLASLGSSTISKQDMFPIYSEDMVASLVLRQSKSATDMSSDLMEKDKFVRECKTKLLWVMKPEIVIRINSANQLLLKNTSHDIVGKYYSLPIHGGLIELIMHHKDRDATGAGHLSIIFTNSNVHTKIQHSFEKRKLQMEKVGAFKSEKQLSSRIQLFWEKVECDILVVQCNAKEDERLIMLTKLVIERYRREYQRKDHSLQKHVYFVLHLDRSIGKTSCFPQLNFLSEWNLIMIDSIECPKIKLPEMCSMTLLDAIKKKRPFYDFLKDELCWAFTRIKYEDQNRDVKSLTDIIDKMENSSQFLEVLEKELWSWIWKHNSGNEEKNWQLAVACDTTLLNTSSCFIHALDTFVFRVIKMPLSKYIYNIELHGCLDSFFSTDKRYTLSGLEIDNIDERQQAWITLLHDNGVFSIDDIPDETGPECYSCPTHDLYLKMPFSLRIFEKVEETKDDFLETVQLYKTELLLRNDDELPHELYEEVLLQQENLIYQKLPDLNKYVYKMWGYDYFDDFCNISSHKYCPCLQKQRTQYAKLIMTRHFKMNFNDPFAFVIRLHTSFWVRLQVFRSEMMLIEASLTVVPGIENEIKKTLSSSVDITATSDSFQEIQSDSATFEYVESSQASESTPCKVLQNECPIDYESEKKKFKDISMDKIVSSFGTLSNTSDTDEQQCRIIYPENLDNAEQLVSFTDFEHETVSVPSNSCEYSFETNAETDDVVDPYGIKNGVFLSPNERLVKLICQKMIPTSDTIFFHGGVRTWYGKVTGTLSLAYQVAQTPKLLYSLKMCSELSAELIVPLALEEQLLVDVGNILDSGLELDSKEVFDKIRSVFDAAFKVDPALYSSISKKCMKILSSYLIKCISCEPETSSLHFMFSLILDNYIREEDIYLLKAPLFLSLSLVEKKLFFRLIETGFDTGHNDYQDNYWSDVVNECGIFESLNHTIISLNETKGIGHMFLILIVDMFQSKFTEYLRENDKDENKTTMTLSDVEVSFTENQLKDTFLSCHRLLRNEEVDIRFIAAIGYLKAYIDYVANKWILNGEIDLSFETLVVVLSDDTGNALCENMNIFLIKNMLRNNILSKVKAFCIRNSSKYRCFQQIKWTDGYSEKSFEKSPLSLFISKEMHEQVILCRQTKNINAYKVKIQQIVLKGKVHVEGMLCLFAVAINDFYLCRLSAPLDDAKRTKAKILINEATGQGLDKNALRFLKCIIGEANFRFDAFNITGQSSETDFFKLSFLSSLYAVVLGNNCFTCSRSRSFVTKCLCAPSELKDGMFPGFRSKGSSCTSKLSARGNMLVRITVCQCGHQIAFYDKRTILLCPICNNKLKHNKHSNAFANMIDFECPFSITPELNVLEYVRGMQPVSSHLIQFIVKACLLASTALNQGDQPILERLTHIPEALVYDKIWDAISCHWETLQELLNVDYNMLFVILQTILIESMDLICNSNSPGTIKELLLWEKQFDQVVGAVLENRFTHIHQYIRNHDSLQECGENVVEQRFLEVDSVVSSTLGERALYRNTVFPCKLNFVSNLYPRRDEFPLLTLVLQNELKLNLPWHILNIINWHKATIANANYMLNKSDCLKMTVQDFIYSKQERDNGRSCLVFERFESFRKSWEYLKNNLMKEDISLKMKRIHSESKMCDCLLLGETSVVFEVLQTLVEIQNNFVTEILSIANSSVALQFLFRQINVAIVPCIQIMDIKQDHLLTCLIDWNALLGQESQCDLRYGHGMYIHYDFESIEQSVAINVLSGKAFIQMTNGFQKIIFKDELHKNYSALLRELKLNIPQKQLPIEIVNGIKSRKEEGPRMVTELLTHLGIVLSLLKKTKGDPDCPLIDYVNGWKSLLGQRFPNQLLPRPVTSTKLCHVIGLSELLEELSADSVRNGLSDEFRCTVDGPIMDQINNILKEGSLAVVFLRAMKRFTYRCLSSRMANANQALREYLSDDTFWPDGCLVDGILVINEKEVHLTDVLPDGLMVRHTVACLAEIEKHIEKRQQEEVKLSAFATSFKTSIRAGPNIKEAEKKRKALNYRKF